MAVDGSAACPRIQTSSVDSAVAGLRDQFPALVSSPQTSYLDSASTTQKPRQVTDTVIRYLTQQTANVGRGAYPWATRLVEEVESVRLRVAAFIHADFTDEVVFTPGATAGLNAVAISWGLANLVDGDEILYSERDHVSAVYPWLNLRDVLARFGVTVRLVPYPLAGNGEADTDALLSLVSPRTRLIAASHLHNVYGTLTTLEELRGHLDPDVLLCFDCSQSIGHIPVDVMALRADFAVFSGHKMFALPGTGVLYCNARTHPTLRPFLPGGGPGVATNGATPWTKGMPGLMEAGTPDTTGNPGARQRARLHRGHRYQPDRRAQRTAHPPPRRPPARRAGSRVPARCGDWQPGWWIRHRVVPATRDPGQ